MLSQTVQSVDTVKNTATLSVKVESMQGTVNGQALPQSDVQKAQKDSATTMVLTTLGKVVSTNLSANVPGMNGNDIGFYQQNGVFPIRAVKPGDTWTSVIDVSGVGAKIASNFQLSELKPSDSATIAIIKQTATGAVTSKAGGALPAGVKLNGNINMAGEIQFDTNAGSIKSQSISGQFDAKVSTPAAAKPAAKTAALKKKAPLAAPTSSKIHLEMTETTTRLDEAIPSATTDHPSP